jgi:uncharacterized protein with von Willebrand factor type A (vWA) domain
MTAHAIDRPYHRLQALPRSLWLPSLVNSSGECGQRLADAACWLGALNAGELPPPAADFGDAAASRSMRDEVAALGLPALCHRTASLAEQVLRTLLWHLDRIADHQPRLTRPQAIERAARDFRSEWQPQLHGLAEDLALLQGLGDLANLQWDELRGRLQTREWQAARRASEWLRQLPELAALLRRLGRRERSTDAAPAAAPQAADRPPARHALRAVTTRLPDAPGEITGVRLSGRLEGMLASEAAMLRHPVLRKLWRARQAEARLLAWQSEAVLTDWRPDPAARPRCAATAEARALERGPILLCLDTSGSMRGAPENVAKAVVIAALRAAHEAGRCCRLLAFGGPDELVEADLDLQRGGLQPLLALMGRSFDGGTDLQTPIERAVACVHEARWAEADLLIVSDGEFGCTPKALEQLDQARQQLGLRVQGVLVGDRETLGLLNVCDEVHWVRHWRRYSEQPAAGGGQSPVHSRSLTALYFPGALSRHAARHRGR